MLPEWQYYNTSVEVLGSQGFGKTSFNVWCERTHILAKSQIIHIAGGKEESYDGLVGFIQRAMPDYRACFINLSGRSSGYNPFLLPKGRDLSSHASALADYAGPQEKESFEARFQEKETSTCFFAYLAVSQLPVWEGIKLLQFDQRKRWLSVELPEKFHYIAQELAGIERTDAWDFKTGALRRWLLPFITSDAIRRVLSIPQPVSIASCYESRTALFVKAVPSKMISPGAAQVFLSLLQADMLQTGLENAGKNRIIPVYMDEIQTWASPKLGEILDSVRSSGLRLTISHHHSEQFSDKRLRESVRTACGIKVVFGGLSPDLRKDLAEEAYATELNTRHHKQERFMQTTTYWEDDAISTTTHPNGETTTTSHPRLRPEQQKEVVGYDDYTREEVISRLAARFLLRPFECIAILPDGTDHIGLPHLNTYLPLTTEHLDLSSNEPERGIHVAGIEDGGNAPKKARKKAAVRKSVLPEN